MVGAEERTTTAKPRWGLVGPLSDSEAFLAHPTADGVLYAPDRDSYIMRVGALHGAGVIDAWLAYLLTYDLGVTLYDSLVAGIERREDHVDLRDLGIHLDDDPVSSIERRGDA